MQEAPRWLKRKPRTEDAQDTRNRLTRPVVLSIALLGAALLSETPFAVFDGGGDHREPKNPPVSQTQVIGEPPKP